MSVLLERNLFICRGLTVYDFWCIISSLELLIIITITIIRINEMFDSML